MEQALREAIVGPGDPEENAATMGRFGWLTALITDLKNNSAAIAALGEEDPDAHFEAMREIDEMIRDVRAVLEGEVDSEPCHGPEDAWCPSCGLGGTRP